MGAIFSFFPAIFMSSTYTDKNIPCFCWTDRQSQFGTFLHPSSSRTSSNCLSHNNPANGCQHNFRSRSTTGSSMFAHDFGHWCHGRRTHTSGHSDFGILSFLAASSNCTWVYGYRANCLSVAIWKSCNNIQTSITFTAVMWDADEPCSVKTAQAPESSFTMSPRSTALSLDFWNLGKVDFLVVSLCFENNILLALDFLQLPCWDCLELFPFLEAWE